MERCPAGSSAAATRCATTAGPCTGEAGAPIARESQMSTAALAAPRFRLARRTRLAVTVAHVISSVAILGQSWVNAVLAVIAMRAWQWPCRILVHAGSGVHRSSAAEHGGAGQRCRVRSGHEVGVLRFRWVAAKLVLLLVVILCGISIQGLLLEQLIAAPSPTARAANLAITGAQFVLLAAATWLSVFKPPGGRVRR